jgi:predicted transporter
VPYEKCGDHSSYYFPVTAFLEYRLEKKIKFGFSFLLTVSLLLATVLLPAKNLDHLMQYNPLTLQGQSNKLVMLFFIVLAIIASFYAKDRNRILFFSIY